LADAGGHASVRDLIGFCDWLTTLADRYWLTGIG
jgi:hypothetical protein